MKVVPAHPRAKQRGKAGSVKPERLPSVYALEPLDPWLMCGPDTTVTELWKVKERRDGETKVHLVYFDRYGWYCEHGRSCAAVAEVKKVVGGMKGSAPRLKPSRQPRGRRGK